MKTICVMTIAFGVMAGTANADNAKLPTDEAKTSAQVVSTPATGPAVESVSGTAQPTSYDFGEYGDNRLNSNG